MDRKLLIVAVAASFACWKGEASVGKCATNSDCPSGSTCNEIHVCQYACATLCASNEVCESGLCVVKGPEVKQVSVPTTWSKRSASVHVTAVVDDTGGPGLDSAFLQIAGQPDIAGTTADTGISRTYAFDVPGSVQAAGSETPVAFTIRGKDTAGQVTRDAAAGTGQLLIDDAGPTVNGVTVNGGVAVSGIKWFKPAASGNIDVQVSIQDAGSGVDTASLTLVSSGRLDTGTPTCVLNAQTQTCHFAVPLSTVPAGSQRRIAFAVAGADAAGNAVKTNTAALGIDGKAPTITIDVAASYPAAGTGCAADATLFCGHDGSHFWRAGESASAKVTFIVSDVYAAPDDVGSGVDQAGSTCSISGSAQTCTVTYDTNTSKFTFPANFADATFSALSDGTGRGTITIKANARDAVGNAAAEATATVNVTRVKWVQKIPVSAIVGAPVVSNQLGQIMIAGTVVSGDMIFSLRMTDGSVAWSAGGGLAPSITSVTTNMALDPTPSTDTAHPTPVLYVNSGNSLYALHIGATGVDKYCSASVPGAAGSPIIFAGGANAEVVAVGSQTIFAYSTAMTPTGGACNPDALQSFGIPGARPTLGPPSANGSTIFFGYTNTANIANDLGVKSIQFSGGAFANALSQNLNKRPTAGTSAAAISPAFDLFFGVDRDGLLYRYGSDLAASPWSSTWTSSPPLAGNLFAQPLVSGSLVFAASDALYAYHVNDGTSAWTFGAGSAQSSAPTIATGTILLSADTGTKEVVAFDPATRQRRWNYAGSSTTTPSTSLSSVATELGLGPDGVLYLGDSGGRVYALFSDATPVVTASQDWPRTGYDNCNSNHANNPGFTCQ